VNFINGNINKTQETAQIEANMNVVHNILNSEPVLQGSSWYGDKLAMVA